SRRLLDTGQTSPPFIPSRAVSTFHRTPMPNRHPLADALLCTLFFAFVFSLHSAPSADKGKSEHIVVVVWDGMRPDFITPQYTPTLYKLAKDGVFFKHHPPVYVSSTEVNGTAIATGCYPNR